MFDTPFEIRGGAIAAAGAIAAGVVIANVMAEAPLPRLDATKYAQCRDVAREGDRTGVTCRTRGALLTLGSDRETVRLPGLRVRVRGANRLPDELDPAGPIRLAVRVDLQNAGKETIVPGADGTPKLYLGVGGRKLTPLPGDAGAQTQFGLGKPLAAGATRGGDLNFAIPRELQPALQRSREGELGVRLADDAGSKLQRIGVIRFQIPAGPNAS